MAVKKVAVLGATGSIGLNTLNVIEQHPDQFEVFALSAHQQYEALFKLCQRYEPRYAVMSNPEHGAVLQAMFKGDKLKTDY